MDSPLLAAAPSGSSGPYRLSSDIAQFCLPAASRDLNRKFAYANSICFAFLIIGLIGFKTPVFEQKALPEIVEYVPIEIVPPAQEPPPPTDAQPDQPEPPLTAPNDAPVMATVVAADASAVSFAVPVEGPVILAPAKFAPPPPAVPRPRTAPPPQPVKFRPVKGSNDGGSYPWPSSYPRQALERRLSGTVEAYLIVNSDGTVLSSEVKTSSGHSVLDRFATEWFRNRWRFPPAEERERHFLVEMEFRL